jgi:SAM-dependent methyltransferase
MTPTSHSTQWVAEEFDRRAATYDRSEMHRWQAQRAAQLLDRQRGQLILDIATGTGLAARAAVERGEGTSVVGIDLSRRMLEVARQKSDARHCFYMQADAQRLPFRAAVFDALICVAAIPYLPKLSGALSEWCRIARSHAALVFTTPAADGIVAHRLLREAAETHGLALPNPHAAYGSPERLGTVVDELGLTLVRVERDTFPDRLDDEPRRAFDWVIDYGFAEPVRTASDDLREAIFETYAELYSAARRRGDSGHDTLFTLCQLARPARSTFDPQARGDGQSVVNQWSVSEKPVKRKVPGDPLVETTSTP